MKSIEKIKTMYKIFKIICLVVFILNIVAAFILVMSITLLPFIENFIIQNGKTIAEILFENNITIPYAYSSLALALYGVGFTIYYSIHLQHVFKKLGEFDNPICQNGLIILKETARAHFTLGAIELLVGIIFVIIMNSIYHFELSNTHGIVAITVSLIFYFVSLFVEYSIEFEKINHKEKQEEIDPEDYAE